MSYICLDYIEDYIFCEINTEVTNFLPNHFFPLFFQVLTVDNSKIIETYEMNSGTWRKYYGFRDKNFRVVTNNNKILRELKYDYKKETYAPNALRLYEFWDYFTKLNSDTVGLILGAGDGTWGEWVKGVLENNVNCYLVEGSDKYFELLKLFHGNKKNLSLIHHLVSLDGEHYDFYDFSDGDNSISEDFLLSRGIDTEGLTKTKQKTKKFSDLLDEIGIVHWIRFDLEGVDFELVMSLELNNLPSLVMIQYEHLNLELEKRNMIYEKFSPFGFSKLEFDIDTILIKN